MAHGGTPAEHGRAVWRLVAFLGRYGHQPVDACLALPVTALKAIAEEVGGMLREEAAAMKGPGDA